MHYEINEYAKCYLCVIENQLMFSCVIGPSSLQFVCVCSCWVLFSSVVLIGWNVDWCKTLWARSSQLCFGVHTVLFELLQFCWLILFFLTGTGVRLVWWFAREHLCQRFLIIGQFDLIYALICLFLFKMNWILRCSLLLDACVCKFNCYCVRLASALQRLLLCISSSSCACMTNEFWALFLWRKVQLALLILWRWDTYSTQSLRL